MCKDNSLSLVRFMKGVMCICKVSQSQGLRKGDADNTGSRKERKGKGPGAEEVAIGNGGKGNGAGQTCPEWGSSLEWPRGDKYQGRLLERP